MMPAKTRPTKFFLARRRWRWLALLVNVHRIHHPRWSFGYVFRPLPWAYFPGKGWRRVPAGSFHDCTWTGRY